MTTRLNARYRVLRVQPTVRAMDEGEKLTLEAKEGVLTEVKIGGRRTTEPNRSRR